MSRSRTRSLSLTTYRNTLNFDSSWNQLNSTGGNYSHTGYSEVMSDTVSPGYFGKIRRGQFLPINDMTHTTYKKEVSVSSQAEYKLWATWNPNFLVGYRRVSGELAMGFLWSKTSSSFPAWVGSLPSVKSDAQLLTEALADARSRGWDALTFFAEWTKTVELIKGFQRRTLQRAGRVADSIMLSRKSRSNLQTTNDLARAFSETWLEGRYGWRILRFDIEAINESLSKLNNARSQYGRGYATDSDTKSRTIYSAGSTSGQILRHTPVDGGTNTLGSGTITQDRVYTKRAGTVLEAMVGDILTVDPLVTAWEVIPFSFIVDWFVNIGDVVTAFSPFAQENLLGAWVSFKDEIRTTSTFTPSGSSKIDYGGYYMQIHTGGGSTSTATTVKQTYSRSPASPSVGLSFDLRLSPAKLVDLSTILILRYTGLLGKLAKHYRV